MQIDYMTMISKHAARCGVTPHRLLGLAGVDPANWSKWMTGASPRVGTVNRVLAMKPEQVRRSG